MGPKLGAITKGGVLVTGTVVGTTGNNSEPIGPNDADLLNEGGASAINSAFRRAGSAAPRRSST
jgi:hypothetical protein